MSEEPLNTDGFPTGAVKFIGATVEPRLWWRLISFFKLNWLFCRSGAEWKAAYKFTVHHENETPRWNLENWK